MALDPVLLPLAFYSLSLVLSSQFSPPFGSRLRFSLVLLLPFLYLGWGVWATGEWLRLLGSVFLVFLFDSCGIPSFRGYLNHRALRASGVPGPAFVPFFGQLPGFFYSHFKQNQLDWIANHYTKYGEFFSMTLGLSLPIVFLNNPEHIADFYKNDRVRYKKAEMTTEVLENLIGRKSLFLLNGPEHAYSRKKLAPVFHFANLTSMIEIFAKKTQEHMKKWVGEYKISGSDTHDLDVLRHMIESTLDVLLCCVFGVNPHSASGGIEEQHQLYQHLKTCSKLNQIRYLTGLSRGLFKYIPIPTNIQFYYHHYQLRKICDKLIIDRKLKNTHSNCSGSDLMDLLLSAKDENGTEFTIDEIREHCLIFFVAGHETVATLLNWCLFELMKNPDLVKELQKEVDTILGGGPGKGDELLTAEKVKELKLSEAVLEETLRLHPPAPYLLKEAVVDHTLESKNDSKITPIPMKKGNCVFVNVPSVHTNPEVWGENCLKFDHRRFLAGPDGKKPPLPHPFAFLPFSNGARDCIGRNFALLEAKVVLALLIHNFEFEMVPGQTIKPIVTVTMNPATPLMARFKLRKS